MQLVNCWATTIYMLFATIARKRQTNATDAMWMELRRWLRFKHKSPQRKTARKEAIIEITPQHSNSRIKYYISVYYYYCIYYTVTIGILSPWAAGKISHTDHWPYCMRYGNVTASDIDYPLHKQSKRNRSAGYFSHLIFHFPNFFISQSVHNPYTYVGLIT